MKWIVFKTAGTIVEGQVARHRLQFVDRDGYATVTGEFRYTCSHCGADKRFEYSVCDCGGK